MHIHKSKYTFGDTVYLKTDPDQHQRIVLELKFSQGQVLYLVGQNGFNSECYDFELSAEPNKNLKLGIEVG